MQAVLGLDVARLTVEACLLQEPEPSALRTFPNTSSGFGELQDWLTAQGLSQVHACLEATGRYGQPLAHFLYTQGHQVSVVNPAQIHYYARSQLRRAKTDKLDAALIAHFCAHQRPRLWEPVSETLRHLQALTRYLAQLKQTRLRQQNRLAAEMPLAEASPVREHLQAHVSFLEQQIHQVEAQIAFLLEQEASLAESAALLMSIPGIGPITAATLLAERIEAFSNVRQVVAYAGLAPWVHQSGQSIRRGGRVCKLGNRRLRQALYWPAVVAMRHNPLIRAFAHRLLKRGKPKQVVIVASMRKLLCLAFGVLKHRQPFDAAYRPQVG